jgi:DNA-binding Xre family transcriptional regulator
LTLAGVNTIIDTMPPDTKIRLRRAEINRLRQLRGIRSEAALARAAGMNRQVLSWLMGMADISHVHLRTIARLCAALSTPDERILIGDLIEQ